MLNIFNRAGGLNYHYIALKYKRKLWGHFAKNVLEELTKWCPTEEEVILVGPSAAYTFPVSFFSAYKKIYILEVDPLARLVLRKKLKTRDAVFITKNLFAEQEILGTASFANFINAKSNAAIMFCNFVGQIGIIKNLASEVKIKEYLQLLENTLKNRSVFSYHDRLSWQIGNSEILDNPFIDENIYKSSQEITAYISKFFEESYKTRYLEVVDHATENFLKKDYRSSSIWEIYPGKYHWIDFCYR